MANQKTPHTSKQRGNIVDYFSNNSSQTYNKTSGYWISLMITNDSISDLTLIVNNIAQIIKAGETFDDDFNSFNTVAVVNAADFRIWLRE